MGTEKRGRTALIDITNHVKKGTYQSPYDNEVRKREEKNRKQREYRARIKAGSSPNIPGTQQSPDDNETRKREERNRKQREYRASKKAQQTNNQRDGMDKFESSPYSSGTTSSVVDQQSPYGTGYSTVLEASTMLQSNELTFAVLYSSLRTRAGMMKIVYNIKMNWTIQKTKKADNFAVKVQCAHSFTSCCYMV
ncbi:hypothetical protein GUJ93_ZPchr0001g31686 [Zizania palustris]|uniref:Uncharacterized protein n=1 Tax=Zizania palustris TaxID=103762 RepID=A0A8J5RV53_ZIZPA|nr:hypothetical protein GUJ93_ZPchr0001g31686 [Zizania palustris]